MTEAIGSKYTLVVKCIIIILLICANLVFAQDTLQRTYIMPPYKGQISGYSDWTTPADAWNELTNCYVDEQGKIVMRPGFYCWKDSVSTSKEILGACEYTKQVEGGATTYFVFNTNNKIYWTTKYHDAINTDISGALSFSDDGIPQFNKFYNMLFMANGEDNPIMYDQDSNVIEIGRSYYSGAITFEDTNEVVSDSIYFDEGDYHYRVGMDLIIEDSNNNNTYEIIYVDNNVIAIKNIDGTAVTLTEETDSAVTLTGIGFPDVLSYSGSSTVTWPNYYQEVTGYDPNEIYVQGGGMIELGFVAGMTLTVSGASANNGSYTILSVGASSFYVDGAISDASMGQIKSGGVSLVGVQTSDTGNVFCPVCIAGHKGRLFVGGVKQYPTYLFWSRSIYATAYFYDLWRDRYGQDDGVGFFDMQDKVIALVPNFNGMLVIFCENSIWYLKGDDPGFDILTPNQSYIFQPVPVTKEIGIIGPNAWERIGNDIFFYSKDGLQQLSIISQQGTLGSNLLSLPIKDVHKTIVNNMTLKKTNFEFLPDMNTLFMLFSETYSSTLDSVVLCYNLANNSFSTFEFDSSSEPMCLFKGDGFDEDPNISDLVYKIANPKRTLWFGSEDGKLFSLHKSFAHDLDYEDTSNASLSNITMTAITSKLNMEQPFLEKDFTRSVFLCSPQINYDWEALGQVSFYRKIDDGSWSSAFTKTFSLHSDATGTPVDYYEYLDPGVGFKGSGKSLQIKISVSGLNGRHGLEFVGAMIEWLPVDYSI